MGLKCIISRRSYGRLCSMKTRIVCLPPGELLPGMIVATQVNGAQGTALIAAGTTLDEPMLEKLKRRGIETLSVVVPDSRDEATIAREIEEAIARIEFIFRGQSSPARDALQETLISYRRKQAE